MNSINQFKVKDSIIYEDDYFLIINKPCGLVVHPTLDQSRLNLIDELKNYRKDNYIALIHRLDKDTSGAILFSKDSVANHFLDEGFKKHTITKKYWALVHGNWDVNGRIEDFLKKIKDSKKREVMTVVQKGGEKAISLVQTIKSTNEMSLVEFTLLTGRMHQIRIQCRSRGFPIIGDLIYGDEKLDKKVESKRMYLHSKCLNFNYNEKLIFVEAPIDLEFEKMYQRLL